MDRIRLLLAACALAASGCATTLAPAPEAERLAPNAAVAVADGVRLVARVEAWQDTPLNLAAEVTPILITVTNRGERPIRVAYGDFTLVADDGTVYRALSPFRMTGRVVAPIEDPPYPVTGFAYAPHVAPYFAGVVRYGTAASWPHPYYHPAPYQPLPRRIELPTVDMLRQALPEGVLQPGGQVSGFVYFERVHGDARRLRLQAAFRAVEGEATVATLHIPFVQG